jgi:hypothetical protein
MFGYLRSNQQGTAINCLPKRPWKQAQIVTNQSTFESDNSMLSQELIKKTAVTILVMLNITN